MASGLEDTSWPGPVSCCFEFNDPEPKGRTAGDLPRGGLEFTARATGNTSLSCLRGG